MQFGIAEKLLLLKVRTKKDPEAFAALYDMYAEKIFRFVRFKIDSREEAEDITSEVFLKVWNFLLEHQETGVRTFSGLVYRIARNSVIDFYRERSRRRECKLDEEMPIIAEDKNYRRIEADQELQALLEKIKQLKQEYQEVILLKYVDELSVAEIAEILGKSSVGVRVTLHRAGKKLQELLWTKS
ncbi:sigma-70 family RNA polymerase sigma factor [Candidatus Falkowbacteria bacterium]|nr:sigma-70 family RNA polymerase sigma factor [Candidatus Falkowbacteria bacterium]